MEVAKTVTKKSKRTKRPSRLRRLATTRRRSLPEKRLMPRKILHGPVTRAFDNPKVAHKIDDKKVTKNKVLS